MSLAEAKLLLAAGQHEVVAAQARDHAVRRPLFRSCGGACHVKDYRQHRIATRFGQITVRLPRFRGIVCGALRRPSTPVGKSPQIGGAGSQAYRLTCRVTGMHPVIRLLEQKGLASLAAGA